MDLSAKAFQVADRTDAARSASRLSPEYRDVVERAAGLLRDTKAKLRLRESRGAHAQREDAVDGIVAGLWIEWREAWTEAMQCLPEVAAAPEQLALAKQYTEARLTPELMGAPLWRQAYAKPLGYPGDYLVMDHIYRGGASGDTPFGRVAHALGVQIGQFVVKRKDFVRNAIAEVVAQCAATAPCVVASLGCGPAQEVAEFVHSGASRGRPVNFILVDQDPHALRFAGSKLCAAASAGVAPATIELRHHSVLRLLRENDPTQLLSRPDMIYSAGLFDYFGDRTCRVLTQRLYEALRPGGLLLLGNMKAGTDMLWPLELIADWSLRYRTAESVLAWADGLPGAEISLRTETTGYDFMLGLRKA